MIFYQFYITLLFSIFISVSAEASGKSTCSRSCNGVKVNYPFGFSDHCEIKLECASNGEMKIGEYSINHMTADHILVNLPVKCDRSVDDLKQFQTHHYAVSSKSSLLLHKCSSPATNCSLPASLVKGRLGSERCDNVTAFTSSCYSLEDNSSRFLNYEMVRNNCRVLVSSIVIHAERYLKDRRSPVALDFQTVELEWWLEGPCSCNANANCTELNMIPNATEKIGYRCLCKEGFTGDGFAAGSGCWKDDCSAAEYVSGRCGKTTRLGFLIGGIVVGAVVMTALGAICYCIRRKSRCLKSQMSAKQLLSEAAGNSSVPYIPYKEIERATNSFSENKRLGTGAYGTVYAGKLYNDELVAVKKMRHRDPESIKQVMNEVKLLSSLSHPNLVRLLGCCIEKGEQILVYEFMPNGTLSQHLQRERGPGLPWTVRLTIASETARAIAHLHSSISPPIYHRDIKSSNILLDHQFNSKVADFGLSRFGMTDDSHISTAPQGTPGYVDPQYHQNYHLSDKSDVYSFGVVLVEIITALKVVDFTRPHSEINLATLAIDRIGKGLMDEIIDPFLEPHRDAWTLTSVHRVAELAFRCLAFHRDMRPSMMEVAEELQQIRFSSWAPMDETLGITSSVASTGSSPYTATEISLTNMTSNNAGVGSRRSVAPIKPRDPLPTREDRRDSSPVSVQELWFSEQSSPSSNSLLDNVVQ